MRIQDPQNEGGMLRQNSNLNLWRVQDNWINDPIQEEEKVDRQMSTELKLVFTVKYHLQIMKLYIVVCL